MAKEYLVKSKWDGDYTFGFVSVEIVSAERLMLLRKLVEDGFSYNMEEVRGKHSLDTFYLDNDDFVIVTSDADDIATFRKLFGEFTGNVQYSEFVLDKYFEQEGELE